MKKKIRYFFLFLSLFWLLECTALAMESAQVTMDSEKSGQESVTVQEGEERDHVLEKEHGPAHDETDEHPSILLKNMEDEDRFGTITVEKKEDGSWVIIKEEYYVSQRLQIGVNIGLSVTVFLTFLYGVSLCGVLRQRLNENYNRANIEKCTKIRQ